jgi:D-alanine--poly(phosphoribitol) ligase subunit 1
MFRETILDRILLSIDLYGSGNAFCINEKFYTYKDLSYLISDIRRLLVSATPKNSSIGIIANDDIETYASIFAIWLEGFAYVPIHPHQPVERNLEIILQADIKVILSSGNSASYPDCKIIDTTEIESGPLNLVPRAVSDTANAYILFTSGSTGKPKGVPITRENLASFIISFEKTGLEISHMDRCLQCFDLTFDVSVQSYLFPLLHGACVYTIPHSQIKYSYAYGLLEDHKLTYCVVAPSLIRYLRPYFEELNFPELKYCIMAAEASTVALLKEWSECIPNAMIYDFYGPTEATIYCTFSVFQKNKENKHLNGLMSIGKPMDGMTAIILNETGNEAGINEPGELCLSGKQLTTGYCNNPEKNKESFFQFEHNGIVRRFYRTGDSCFIDKEGDILYGGRLDNQVKIQGYRIELGEIEYHTREFLNGINSVAVTYENSSGNEEIALFIEDTSSDTTRLIEHLKSKIPPYMIPSKLLFNKSFPLNSNGKTDRKILKSLVTA